MLQNMKRSYIYHIIELCLCEVGFFESINNIYCSLPIKSL